MGYDIERATPCRVVLTATVGSSEVQEEREHVVAGFVRAAGGYVKTPGPFEEFQWADFFRRRIKKNCLVNDFEKALRKALRLAASRDAAKLPGYVGPRRGAKHPG